MSRKCNRKRTRAVVFGEILCALVFSYRVRRARKEGAALLQAIEDACDEFAVPMPSSLRDQLQAYRTIKRFSERRAA